MDNTIEHLIDLIALAWEYVVGFYNKKKADIVVRLTNIRNTIVRLAWFVLIAMGVSIAIFCVCKIFNLNGPIMFLGIIWSLVFFFAWKVPNIFISAVSALTSKIPGVKEIVPLAMEDCKKLLSPVLTISFAFAFIAGIAGTKGVGQFGWGEIMMLVSATLCAAIFTVYIDSKTKWAGWIMMAVLGFFLFGYYLFPVQVQGAIEYLDRISVHRSLVASNQTKAYKQIILPKGTVLFTDKWSWQNWTGGLERASVLGEEQKANVINVTEDKKSGEQLYEVVLPSSVVNGSPVYIDGKIVLVPTRAVTLIPLMNDQGGRANVPSAKKAEETLATGEHTFRLACGSTKFIEISGGSIKGDAQTGDFAFIGPDLKALPWGKGQEWIPTGTVGIMGLGCDGNMNVISIKVS